MSIIPTRSQSLHWTERMSLLFPIHILYPVLALYSWSRAPPLCLYYRTCTCWAELLSLLHLHAPFNYSSTLIVQALFLFPHFLLRYLKALIAHDSSFSPCSYIYPSLLLHCTHGTGILILHIHFQDGLMDGHSFSLLYSYPVQLLHCTHSVGFFFFAPLTLPTQFFHSSDKFFFSSTL